MTALLRSEIRRLASRRLLRWTLLVTLGLVAFLVVFVTSQSDPDSLSNEDLITPLQLWLTKTSAATRGLPRDNAIATISVLTYLMVIVIGASAIGAEYRAGTVGTMLTWEPRRIRLLVARLVATALIAMAYFLIVHLVFVGTWTLGAELNGRTTGADADFWRDLLILLGRATLVAGVLAVISAALATLGRNTAAAMGIWFGYLIAIEAILASQVSELVPWFLIPNLGAFYGWEAIRASGHSVEAGAATLRLLLYVLVFGAAAVTVFKRRDVT